MVVAPTMGKRLFVGNLPYSAREEEIRSFFAQDGRQVSEVKIVMDRDTGRPRGFAFVEFASEDEAQSAVAALNGKEMNGRALTVSEARERGGGGRAGY